MTGVERDQLILGSPPRLEPLRPDQCGPKELEVLAALRKSIGLPDGPLPELVATRSSLRAQKKSPCNAGAF